MVAVAIDRMAPRRLSNFPYVRVRIGCEQCKRSGNLSLARLAEKYGAEASIQQVLAWLTTDCPWRGYGKKANQCFAKFIDLETSSPPPPDMPPGMMGLRVIPGGKKDKPCDPGGDDQSTGNVRPRRSNPSS